jgi:hypothetical protein
MGWESVWPGRLLPVVLALKHRNVIDVKRFDIDVIFCRLDE